MFFRQAPPPSEHFFPNAILWNKPEVIKKRPLGIKDNSEVAWIHFWVGVAIFGREMTDQLIAEEINHDMAFIFAAGLTADSFVERGGGFKVMNWNGQMKIHIHPESFCWDPMGSGKSQTYPGFNDARRLF